MNEPVAWWDGKEPSVLGLSYFKNDYCPIPLYIHPADESFDRTASHMAGEYVSYSAKTLTDEEIMEIFTAYEQMQEYGYVGKKPFKVHVGWNLSERNDCLMLAKAILRKAQEK